MDPLKRAKARIFLANLVKLFIAIVMLTPIVWGFSTSLKKPADVTRFPPELVPSDPTISNYTLLFEEGIALPIFNSVVVSVSTVVFCLMVGLVAAYAISRYQFRGRSIVLLSVIAVMSIPLPSLLVPTYTFLFHLNLLDSRIGLIVLYTAYQLPLAIWILFGFVQTLPRELDKAAMIDGYSRPEIVLKIILPLSRVGLVAAGLFILTFAWNDFIIAVIMNSDIEVRTLPVAVYQFLGVFGREWGPLTAASMISILPIIVIFIIFQRYFLSGVTGGAIKG